MKTRDYKLIGLLALIYVFVGVFVFPFWYLDVLRDGGVYALLFEAFSVYFPWTLMAIVVIFLIWFGYSRLPAEQKIVGAVDRYLDSPYYPVFVGVLILTAAVRLSSANIISAQERFGKVFTEAVTQLEESKQPKKLIDKPVDFIFVEKSKIEGAFDQARPSLRLESKKVGSKGTSSLSGSGGVPEIAKVEGGVSQEKSTETSYKEHETTVASKAVDLINGLHKQHVLSAVARVEVQSKELYEFDNAIKIVSGKYGLALPQNQIQNLRNKIISDNISSAPAFKVNNWVLITGPIYISWSDQKALLRFDYIPSIPSKIRFTTEVPKKSPECHLESLSGENTWELSIFGKISHRKEMQGDVLYKVNCYAIYR